MNVHRLGGAQHCWNLSEGLFQAINLVLQTVNFVNVSFLGAEKA